MTIDLSSIRFGYDEPRVVRAVQQHPRLTALLPTSLEELVRAFTTAKTTAAAVAALKVEAVDYADALDANMRAGEQPDAAELVAKYAAAQREAAEIQAVVAQLSALPSRYRNDIVREVVAAAETMYEDLADQLDDVLDRGTALGAQLDGIDSAEEAVDADLVTEWKALKALSTEYAEIRDAGLALARAEDQLNFSPGSLGVALLLFANIETAIPNVADLIARGTDGGLVGFVREGLPFPVADYRDPAHFLAVLRNRDILQPHVARPSEVSDRRTALYAAEQPDGFQPEPGRLAERHGGAENAMRNSHVARRARSEGASQWMSGGFVGGRIEMDLSR